MQFFLDKQPFELNLILKCCNLQDLVKTAITNAAVEENQPETREGKKCNNCQLSFCGNILSIVNCLCGNIDPNADDNAVEDDENKRR